ncbi:NAD(P)-binding protein [Polyplosphaeria fusca]|uniref:NAD(P)-binding protein n=1 Tax=Polyplosphaeria fusca TaxID=682080 RepID=A0A9P4QXU6_9PLEO|nr:NAD(P)-binding protein [Polyplosphaeria fusca]
MGAQWSQFFPSAPTYTEADVASLEGKVFVITGGYSGIGLCLATMLYQSGGKVYIAGRSEAKFLEALKHIQQTVRLEQEGGSIHFLQLELDDLRSIKRTVEEFKKKENRLDVLWNNAGVSQPPIGSVSKQGVELQLATNCLGPFLLTQMLLPLLESTAAGSKEKGSVRVVWLSSQIMELSAPKGGIVMADLTSPPKDKTKLYVTSKTGNYFLAAELARRVGKKGIVSVTLNPGAASTNLFRHTPWMTYFAWPLLHRPKLAAFTELYAGLSLDVSQENNGCYVVPWGKIHQSMRADLIEAVKAKSEGGSGKAEEFWEFCEKYTNDYM